MGRSHRPTRGPRRATQRARYDHLGWQERVSRKPSTRAGHWWLHTGTLMVDRFLQKTDFVLGVGTSFYHLGFQCPYAQPCRLGSSDQLRGGSQQGLPESTWGPSAMRGSWWSRSSRKSVGSSGPTGGADGRGVAAEIAAIRAEFNAAWAPRFRSDEVPINPYRVFAELARAVEGAQHHHHPRLGLSPRPARAVLAAPSPPEGTSAGANRPSLATAWVWPWGPS